MFSYFYIFFFFSHGRSVVSLSHLYISFFRCVVVVAICRVLCFLGIKESKCSSRPPRVLYGSSDTIVREGLKREANQAKVYRVSISSGVLSSIRSLSHGSFRRSIVGSQVRSVSAHSLFLRARVRSLHDERKRR